MREAGVELVDSDLTLVAAELVAVGVEGQPASLSMSDLPARRSAIVSAALADHIVLVGIEEPHSFHQLLWNLQRDLAVAGKDTFVAPDRRAASG